MPKRPAERLVRWATCSFRQFDLHIPPCWGPRRCKTHPPRWRAVLSFPETEALTRVSLSTQPTPAWPY